MFNRPVKLKTIVNIFIKGKLDYYKLDHHIPKFKRYPRSKMKKLLGYASF